MHKITLAVSAVLAGFAAVSPASAFGLAPRVTIVTLNMAKETSANRILREWTAAPRLREADIFLLQEIQEDPATQCIANRLGAALGLHVAYSAEQPGVTDRGLAILSRFPLRDVQTQVLTHYDLRFHSRNRFALSATAVTPWGPVRISDVHLDTRLNAAERLAQLAPVVRDSARFPGRRIVAGDFNSNPFYWVEHVLPVPALQSQAAAVDTYMKREGFRTAVPESATTFDYLGMHLDWIWMSGLRSNSYEVLPLAFSDHHAVWTRLELD